VKLFRAQEPAVADRDGGGQVVDDWPRDGRVDLECDLECTLEIRYPGQIPEDGPGSPDRG